MFNRILSQTVPVERALDAAWTRNEVIAQNIANVDTPGYKRKVVKFEEFLDAEMQKARLITGRPSCPVLAWPW
jgi:flagellar basal-body rod protein FlgB